MNSKPIQTAEAGRCEMSKCKRIILTEGDDVLIQCVNPKNKAEYSTYRIRCTKDDWQGDGLEDVFMAETTGYEEEEITNEPEC